MYIGNLDQKKSNSKGKHDKYFWSTSQIPQEQRHVQVLRLVKKEQYLRTWWLKKKNAWLLQLKLWIFWAWLGSSKMTMFWNEMWWLEICSTSSSFTSSDFLFGPTIFLLPLSFSEPLSWSQMLTPLYAWDDCHQMYNEMSGPAETARFTHTHRESTLALLC